MIYLAIFDSNGKIIGRIATADRDNLSHYELAIEIDQEDFYSKLERWAEIDVKTKILYRKVGWDDPTSKQRKTQG